MILLPFGCAKMRTVKFLLHSPGLLFRRTESVEVRSSTGELYVPWVPARSVGRPPPGRERLNLSVTHRKQSRRHLSPQSAPTAVVSHYLNVYHKAWPKTHPSPPGPVGFRKSLNQKRKKRGRRDRTRLLDV